jgi:Mn2+/Fe2+ NRAMP family transporter
MNTDRNIQKVALIFFFVVGIIHIIAHLMLTNGHMVQTAYAAKSILEIPFILSAAVYGFMSLKISFTTSEKEHKLANIILILLVIILFAILVYLHLFIPDRV